MGETIVKETIVNSANTLGIDIYDKETRLLNYLCLQIFSMVTVATKVSKGNLLFEPFEGCEPSKLCLQMLVTWWYNTFLLDKLLLSI